MSGSEPDIAAGTDEFAPEVDENAADAAPPAAVGEVAPTPVVPPNDKGRKPAEGKERTVSDERGGEHGDGGTSPPKVEAAIRDVCQVVKLNPKFGALYSDVTAGKKEKVTIRASLPSDIKGVYVWAFLTVIHNKTAATPPAPHVTRDSKSGVELAEPETPDPKASGDAEDPPESGTGWTHLGVAALGAGVGLVSVFLLAAVLYGVYVRPAGDATPALGDEFAERIAAKVSVPRTDPSLHRRIDEVVARLPPKSDKAEPPTPTPPSPVLSPEEKQRLLDAVKAAAAPPKAAGGPAAVPADVLVVVTHGSTMDARPYTDPLRDVVKDFRAKDGAVRVGLALGQADQVVPLVPVEAPAAKLDTIDPPNPDYAESPALLGGKVKNAFKENRPRQRAVLVVSGGCDPVKSNAPGWNTLSDVHVVVVARREVGGADRDRLARWFEFAEATRGTVHLIAHHDKPDRQKAELEKCLRRLVTMPYLSGGP